MYSSILAGFRVMGGWVLVFVRTHIETTWVLDVSPDDTGDGHLESRKKSDRLKRSVHVDRICVHSTFVYINAGLRVLML